MRVVVTGTRHGRPDVAYWLDRFVTKHGVPELFVLGDAPGVDSAAHDLATTRRWPHAVLYADPEQSSPARYHERNERMVRLAVQGGDGGWCLAFPVEGSRGTHHCAGYARALGLRVAMLAITDHHRVSRGFR